MNTDLKFRLLQREDCEECLALFDSNVPEFFYPLERKQFSFFLEESVGQGYYYVLSKRNQTIVACGGLAPATDDHSVAGLCFGMVRRDLHRIGIGERLLRERLAIILADERHNAVVLETTPQTGAFFASFGFNLTGYEADGFGPGYDRVFMRLEIADWRHSYDTPDSH